MDEPFAQQLSSNRQRRLLVKRARQWKLGHGGVNSFQWISS
jgi:hypothetical protein